MQFIRTTFELFKAAFDEWNADKAPRLAAALAYYTAFSIAPLLVIVIAVAGLAFGQEAARGEILRQISGVVGAESAEMIETMIANSRDTSSGVLATVLGLAAILFGAAGFFGQLQDALNTVWEVTPKPGRGFIQIIKDRFLSFTMVLGIGFLLLVSLIISAVIVSLDNFVSGLLPQAQLLTQVVNALISFGIVTLLFAMIYKILPDVEIEWRDVWFGAVVTALLFTIGKFLLGLYLGNSGVSSTYGVAGSFVVLLLWVYYSAQILLFGAELTQVYARRRGSHIRPADNAMPVTDAQRANEGTPRYQTPHQPRDRAVESPSVSRQAPYSRVVSHEAAPMPADMQPVATPGRERRWSGFWFGLAAYNALVAVFTVIILGRKQEGQ